MHASFSMRGKSYKMIQRRSSSRINDENFLLVLKKMSHNHFEGERTQKWPQEKYILKFSWIMPQDEQNKFSKIILFFCLCWNVGIVQSQNAYITKDRKSPSRVMNSWHWKKLEFKRLRNSNCIFVKSLQCYFAYANLFLASHLSSSWMM